MSESRRRPRGLAIEIRELQLRDLPAVFELGQKLFTAEELPTLYRCWAEKGLMHIHTTNADTCLVADLDERIVGFALGSIMEKEGSAWRYGWLEWLGVDPRFKRRRVAKRLLAQLTQLFIEREARIMLVDTDSDNADALTFFRKHGFGQERKHIYLSQNLDDHPKSVERRTLTAEARDE
jgi:ribosomal protein S18 acetylase RimI-like enzyme